MYYFTNNSKTVLMRKEGEGYTYIPAVTNNRDFKEYLESGFEANVFPEEPTLPNEAQPVTVEEETVEE